jgi:GT2 family glycosyltransferase/glycosyltransferase involved in cell wall biosynthesis
MTGVDDDLVSVIVPVYEGLDEIEACIDSVARHAGSTKTPFELVLIDDASPTPAVATFLESVTTRHANIPVRLVRNDANRGFVASVNRGIAMTEGDVVLLNSDTVVTDGWLDRLASAARTEPDVATVTPLTNHGSICTLPPAIIEAFELDGPEPRIDDCGSFVATHSAGMRPEVITGVGFCMFVTRRALEWCGPFDEVTFGRGYGEEVDFCLKASRLGLRHLVEDSTYVHHRGGVSFGDLRNEGMMTASRLLRRRYRWFRDVNRRERADDPLLVTFTSLELGLAERDTSRPHVLHVLHGPPDDVGGTEKHLDALLDALGDEFDFSILFPIEAGYVLRTRWNRGDGRVTVHELQLPGAMRWVTDGYDAVAGEALALALDLYDFDAIHIQNLIRHSLAPLAVLAGYEGRVVCSVHDLYLACPHYSLLYRNEADCGLPDDLAVCARCLPETEGLTVADLESFRARVAASIDRIDDWVFASQSAADYLNRVYEIEPSRQHVVPHGTTVDPDRRGRLDSGTVYDEPLRLAIVGRGSPKKGIALASQLADDLAASTIEIHHFGELVGDGSDRLHQHGRYDNELLGELLHQTGIQIVLLPGAYAETFGLVMTEALLAGLPVIGAHYGALGERIRADRVGWTIDPADPAELRELVERLDACRWEVERAAARAAATGFETVAQTAPRYASLYRSGTHEREDQR